MWILWAWLEREELGVGIEGPESRGKACWLPVPCAASLHDLAAPLDSGGEDTPSVHRKAPGLTHSYIPRSPGPACWPHVWLWQSCHIQLPSDALSSVKWSQDTLVPLASLTLRVMLVSYASLSEGGTWPFPSCPEAHVQALTF